MYADRVLFPESSNREDLNRTISIFDDDTGSPVNLAGIISLTNPNGFTGNNWNVTDGSITTTSTTSITVPGYPLTNELSALSLTVDPGLGILAGDPIDIKDALGQAEIAGYVVSYTSSNGALSVQIGLTFQFEIRRVREARNFADDYSSWYAWGGPAGPDPPIISAALGTGLYITGLGYLLIRIPESTMRALHHRTYSMCLTATDSVDTRQIFIGRLPMLFGGVTN